MKLQLVNKSSIDLSVDGGLLAPSASKNFHTKNKKKFIDNLKGISEKVSFLEKKNVIVFYDLENENENENDLENDITLEKIRSFDIDELKKFAKENEIQFGGNIGRDTLLAKIEKEIDCL
jgi:hypothetical protein